MGDVDGRSQGSEMRGAQMDDLLEALAERSHIGWMEEKQRQGYADHVRSIDANGIGCCTNEKHHPDMLPYAELPEHIKEYDRVTVRGVLDGIEAAGYRVVPSITATSAARQRD